jgi:anti-sigma factor RsiW
VNCALNPNLLEGYLDGELGFERTLEVEAHLASCPRCSSQVQSWQQVRSALQRPDFYYRASDSLRQNVRALVPHKAAPAVVPSFQRWLWAAGGAAFATALLLLVFVFLGRISFFPARLSAQEVVASHVRSLMADHLFDVASTDQHTVKPWFDGKLDFAPPVQDFAAQGFPLVGGRLDYLDQRKVAVLVYRRNLHIINLYIWPAADNSASTATPQTVRGYNVLSWKNNAFEFRAVSDLNPAELRDFSRLVSP